MDNKRDHRRGRKCERFGCSSAKHVLRLQHHNLLFCLCFWFGRHTSLSSEVKGVFVTLHRQCLFGSIPYFFSSLISKPLQLGSSNFIVSVTMRLCLSRSLTLVKPTPLGFICDSWQEAKEIYIYICFRLWFLFFYCYFVN